MADFISRIQSGESFNASAVQKEMSRLWGEMITEPDRVMFLGVHRAVMDLVERTGGLTGDALRRFQDIRESEYRLFLMQEAMLDGDNVDPGELDRVTAREVVDGRMAPDNDYWEFARSAVAVMGSPKPRETGWLGKLFK
ncbi:MAG: hypothetical protein LCH57_13175 [Proteobacteria bacterium]|nr:hypothetical protein [Pseudomonadota bacterium]